MNRPNTSSRPARFRPGTGTLAAAAFLVAFLSLGLGRYGLTPSEVAHALWLGFCGKFGAGFGLGSNPPTPDELTAVRIVWDVRLPRVALAFMAGGGLAAAGAALQAVFRNPLVDPHVIGVTSGAAFGGALAILAGSSALTLGASAFVFGLVALGIVGLAAASCGREDRLFVVLAGIIVAGIFSALVALLQYVADAEETLPSIVFWLMGSFASANADRALAACPGIAVAVGILWRMRWHLNLLGLDERDAASLGVRILPMRRAVLFLSAWITALQVGVSGSIGWVGLVVPHLARLAVGTDYRRALPASFWIGAGFMVVVDDAARTLTAAEIPLGILTALAGAPVFAVLLWRNRGKLRE